MKQKNDSIDTLLAQALQDATVKACPALFASHGIEVHREDEPVPEERASPNQLVGLIGFSGPVAKGMLGIGGPLSLFEATHPASRSETPLTKSEVYDWIAELSNQFLGRIANIVSPQDIELSLSTPSVLTGDLLEIVQSDPGACERFAFRCGDARFYVCLDVRRQAGAVFPRPDRPAGPPAAAAEEGDAVLF